jgi:hypothetical protein
MTAAASLSWRARPFDGALHHEQIEPASRDGRLPTLAQITKGRTGLPRGFAECGEIRINGDLVPRAIWSRVRPKPGSAVTAHVPMRGGGAQGGTGGGKNTVAMVATIAVLLAAAAAVSGGTLGPLANGLASGGFIIGAPIFGAAIGVGGTLQTWRKYS